ncbi:MAG: c-type cytochrome [Gemmatimonadaceae bacterium]|nr:c-type cytochrome [Gemmatimonadaceae bacterium]NUS48875.1 c-type cytochrome [Gemmatimonadaceae bacterium]
MRRALFRPRAIRRLLMALVVALPVVSACEPGDGDVASANQITGGDADRGRELIRSYGCGTCHSIPGVTGASGLVGPPLGGIASRAYIAGVLPNAPDNMLRWLHDPRAVDSLTAMPNVGLTPSDARHIAAYLYTLR